MPTPVQVKTLLFGVDVEGMTTSELINAIKSAKAERETLAKANEGVDSQFIASQIEGLNSAIDLAKSVLDFRNPTPAVTHVTPVSE